MTYGIEIEIVGWIVLDAQKMMVMMMMMMMMMGIIMIRNKP